MVRAEAPSELCQEPGTPTESLDPQHATTMGTEQLFTLGLKTAKG
jgi:hypothetical protein